MAPLNDFVYALNTFDHLLTHSYPNELTLTKLVKKQLPYNQTVRETIEFLKEFYLSHTHYVWLFESNILKEIVRSLENIWMSVNPETIIEISQFLNAIYSVINEDQQLIVLNEYHLGKRVWKHIGKVENPFPLLCDMVYLYSRIDLVENEKFIDFHVKFLDDYILKFLRKFKGRANKEQAALIRFSLDYGKRLFTNKVNYDNKNLLARCNALCSSSIPLLNIVPGVKFTRPKQQNDDVLCSVFSLLRKIYSVNEATYIVNYLYAKQTRFWTVLSPLVLNEKLSLKVCEEISLFLGLLLKSKREVYGIVWGQVLDFTVRCIEKNELKTKKIDKGSRTVNSKESLFVINLQNYLAIYKLLNSDSIYTMRLDDYKIILNQLNNQLQQNINNSFIDYKTLETILEMANVLVEINPKDCHDFLSRLSAFFKFKEHEKNIELLEIFYGNLKVDSKFFVSLVDNYCFNAFIDNSIPILVNFLADENFDERNFIPLESTLKLLSQIFTTCSDNKSYDKIESSLILIEDNNFTILLTRNISFLENETILDYFLKLILTIPDTNGDSSISWNNLLGGEKIQLKIKILSLLISCIEDPFYNISLLSKHLDLHDSIITLSRDSELQPFCFKFFRVLVDRQVKFFDELSLEFLQIFMNIDICLNIVIPGLQTPVVYNESIGILTGLVEFPQVSQYLVTSNVMLHLLNLYKRDYWLINPIMSIFSRFVFITSNQVSHLNIAHLLNIGIYSLIDTLCEQVNQVINAENAEICKKIETGITFCFYIINNTSMVNVQAMRSLQNYKNNINSLVFIILSSKDWVLWDDSLLSVVISTYERLILSQPVDTLAGLVNMQEYY